MCNGRLQIGDQALDASTKERIKDHGRNTDGKSATGIDERFTHASWKEGHSARRRGLR